MLCKHDFCLGFTSYSEASLNRYELFCLLPISIVRTSAGTIRAVPDTVKKVPGLAPVLFYYHFKKITKQISLDG